MRSGAAPRDFVKKGQAQTRFPFICYQRRKNAIVEERERRSFY